MSKEKEEREDKEKVRIHSVFRAKIGKVGSNPKSYHIIIPMSYCKAHNLSKGDIVECKITRKLSHKENVFIDATSISIALDQVMPLLKKAKKLGFSEEMIEHAREEAKHFLSLLTKRQKLCRPPESVAAASLYVVGYNDEQPVTQKVLSDFFGITEVTLRNNLKKAWKAWKWKWDDENWRETGKWKWRLLRKELGEQ